MADAHPIRVAGDSTPVVGRGTADWLCLAATPTFATMALLTGFSGGAPDMLCSAMPDALPLNGMTAMYGLMAVFHLTPWLKLIATRD